MNFMRAITAILVLPLVAACTLNYPKRPDAELVLPLVSGLEIPPSKEAFDLSRNLGAVKVNRALAQQYVFSRYQVNEITHHCSADNTRSWPQDESPLIRITRVLEPMNWEPLEEGDGVFAPAEGWHKVPGGVLFGRGVAVEGATLLSLRYVLSPFDDDHYLWEKNGQAMNIPYQYLELQEISMRQTVIDMLTEPTVIYADSDCKVADGILNDTDMVEFSTDVPDIDPSKACLPISATRTTDLSFSTAPNSAPVRYTGRSPRGGWIDVGHISQFKEGGHYMQVVRALTLAQAGDCDLAYTVFMEKLNPVEELNERTKEQVLTIILHLWGRAGNDVSKLLDTLLDLTGPTPLYHQYSEFTGRTTP